MRSIMLCGHVQMEVYSKLSLLEINCEIILLQSIRAIVSVQMELLVVCGILYPTYFNIHQTLLECMLKPRQHVLSAPILETHALLHTPIR